MKNSWNRFIYACWAPVYDLFVGVSPLMDARRQAIARLQLQSGDRLLIVGIGTGADLPLLPQGIEVVGVDLSRAMLRSAMGKSHIAAPQRTLLVADAARLPLPSKRFDAVLLGLVLSVVPDPQACLAEVTRIAAPDCRIIVWDKFLHDTKPSLWRRLANVPTRLFGTDINRDFNRILMGSRLRVVSREPIAFGRAYELIELRHVSCITG